MALTKQIKEKNRSWAFWLLGDAPSWAAPGRSLASWASLGLSWALMWSPGIFQKHPKLDQHLSCFWNRIFGGFELILEVNISWHENPIKKGA